MEAYLREYIAGGGGGGEAYLREYIAGEGLEMGWACHILNCIYFVFQKIESTSAFQMV